MVDLPILPRDLPEATEPLSPTDVFIVDQGSGGLVAKVTASPIVDSVAPLASEIEAQIGTDNIKRMSSLRVKQSIASEVGVSVASYAAGQAGLSAVQTVNGKSGNTVTLNKSDIGLGNVDNTSDANKPISTSTQAALDLKANASLSIVPGSGISGGGNLTGNITISLDNPSIASLAKADSAVQSVNSKTGSTIVINKADIGLGNVDNTSDADKPVSTAQASAIALKANAAINISAGAGLTGGGTLAANRTIALSSASIASLALADSAVQPAALNDYATLTQLATKFNNPTGTVSQYIRGDGSLATFPSIPQGTVTSVGLTAPSGFSVSGSPVTSSGSLSLSYAAGYQGYTSAEATKLAGLNSANYATASQGAKADTALQAPGGLTGQVLSKASNVDNDVVWTTSESATAVSYGPQTLNDAQKTQARQNIDAFKHPSGTDLQYINGLGLNIDITDLQSYGTNANGEFWRFNSGLQITARATTTTDITNTAGALFVNGAAIGPYALAASFIAVPFEMVTGRCTSGNNHSIASSVNIPTTTQSSSIQLFRTTASSSIFYATLVHIGRWK